MANVIRLIPDLKTLQDDSPSLTKEIYPLAIVLSQACDLEQDYRNRSANKRSRLTEILFCPIETAQEIRNREGEERIVTEQWKQIKNNKAERFHFLETIPAEYDCENAGFPELCIDFKSYFTMPTSEVYHRIQLKEAKRRTVLQSPYLEHLSRRFANYLSRIGLPRDHSSE
jgi:hypothetical protein